MIITRQATSKACFRFVFLNFIKEIFGAFKRNSPQAFQTTIPCGLHVSFYGFLD